MAVTERWEHFQHEADIGVRGIGATPETAFEQAALALTAIVTEVSHVRANNIVEIACEAPDLELLFVDWLNSVIYEMSVRKMLFSTSSVRLHAGSLSATLGGEQVNIAKHHPAVEPKPGAVSTFAKRRQQDEMGTLGSGNHYLEVQEVAEIFHPTIAKGFGLEPGQIVVSIHCGSRGLGHQIGTEFLKEMVIAASSFGIELPDRELACAPIQSELGERYLGAMRAAINCALANRQILTHLTRKAFAKVLPQAKLSLLYDVSHNTCKVEEHFINGRKRLLYVHRKGATRAFGPGHPDLPDAYKDLGQPVLIGGSMGTESYVLAGVSEMRGLERAFSSACHGAGRQMSRTEARRHWQGRTVVDSLAGRGILVRSPSMRGVAEEAFIPNPMDTKLLRRENKPKRHTYSSALWIDCNVTVATTVTTITCSARPTSATRCW
ncbi:archease [Ralstonia pseudosolanacearum]|uniref:archease n=1 Tax=Ralstonia pseudosolanacearum TaxID=1310165 RepID=UPI003AAC7D19